MEKRKAIIILTGVNDGKTLFASIAKNENKEYYQEDGWWTWSINTNNVLNVASKPLGFDGLRDDRYYEFLAKLKALANEYWNFEENYIEEMVQKFNDNDKTHLLIIHGVDDRMTKSLQENHGAFTVMITSTKSNKDFTELYDKVLTWDKDTFVQDVVEFLNILTKNK